MSKLTFLLVISTLLLFLTSFSQNGSDQLLKVVPPSPNVASLGKYGDVPVGLYTGVPNISIPLYEIKDGSLDLPVSLSYHAGGIKVEEIASSVGLSWSLNAGGVIGRNVRGLPDDISNWPLRDSANSIENIMLSGDYKKIEQLARDVDRGLIDGEADIYYYNFNQFSGKFFYDQKGNVHTLPAKNILINPTEIGWKITAEDGTVYTFEKVEQVSSVNCSPVDHSVYTAWFLTSIKSADGKREITLEYDKVNYTYETLISQTKYFAYNGNGTCMSGQPPCIGTQNYNTYRLAKIKFGDGYVKFKYNNTRCDLMMDKSLDEVEVRSNNNELLRKFTLGYSYFGNNSNGCNLLTQNFKRLKLVSLTEENANIQKPPYVFVYNESIELPGRLSFSQDHWGYYNGKVNTDMIATFTTTMLSGQLATFKGADRSANPKTAQAGILTNIIYPTGGETSFTYESNTVSDSRVESQTIDQVINFGATNQLVSSLPNPFGSEELIIPASGAVVQFDVSGLTSSLWWGCDIVHCYMIKDNSPFGEIDNGWNGITTILQAGTYKLRLINECGVSSIADFHVTIKAEIPIVQTADERPVGGLRIKQIEDKPGDGGQSIIKNYSYHADNDSKHSSGMLVNFPDYGYDLKTITYDLSEAGDFKGPGTTCYYRVRQSFSNYPLSTTQGSYVGYGHVIVDQGDGESSYSFNAYSDIINPGFPFAPIENFDWTRGFLFNTKDFIRKNGVFTLARETINRPASFSQHKMYGIKTGKTMYETVNGEIIPHLQPIPKYVFYPTMTEFYTLGLSKEKLYDQNDPSKFIETITDYTYSPQHLQLVQSKTTTSNSNQSTVEEIVSHKKYPFDYVFSGVPLGGEATGIKNLQDLHAANAVIEEYVVKQNRNIITNQLSDQRVVNAGITTYKTDKPYPDQLLRLENGSPIPLENFGNGSILTANTFIKNADAAINNSYKTAVIFNSYDDVGNITTQQKAADIKKSYIWGYNSKYPVAEVVGEDYVTIIANSNLDQSILQSLSTSDDQMRTELNKVRTKFPAALVTTYTYKPLVGVTSQTDINNRSTYYYYDSLGRLLLIRDNDKNILKRFCYNYKGQPGDCIINVDTH